MGVTARRADPTVAGLWGFSEATLFFIVPDVWISWVAFRGDLRAALAAALSALAGALLGGSVIYWMAVSDHAATLAVIERVPVISMAMVERVAAQLQERGAGAIVIGAFQGIPYKVYAVQAAEAGLGFAAFALVTVPARLLRFALVAVLAVGCSRLLRHWPMVVRLRLLAGFWVIFYAFYFWLMAAAAGDGELSNASSFIQSLALSPR